MSVPYTKPCPECEGRGFTRADVGGQRESDKCSWCHGGGVVPGGERRKSAMLECERCGGTGNGMHVPGELAPCEWCSGTGRTVEVECQKCEIRAMHYQSECPTLCTDGGLHDVAATYQSYGYWRGECRRCHKVWEVDSSG